MDSNGRHDPRTPSTPPQSIPLQDLARPDDTGYRDWNSARGRTLVSATAGPSSASSYGTRYERLDDASPSPTERMSSNTNLPRPPRIVEPEYESPIENPAAFQAAMGFGFSGLDLGEPSNRARPTRNTESRDLTDVDVLSPYAQPYLNAHDPSDSYFHVDSDDIPLTNPDYLQPISGAQGPSTPGQAHDRSSFQSIRFTTPESKLRKSRLGDDLPAVLQAGSDPRRGRAFGDSLSPLHQRRSRSGSSVAESPLLARAGSIMRAMSQRVVNVSNEAEPADHMSRRKASVIEEPSEDISSIHVVDAFYPPESLGTPVEKSTSKTSLRDIPPEERWPAVNPFRGKSLGIFPPDSPLRIRLCNLLMKPVTELGILVLIVLQTILLSIESGPNVFEVPRSSHWGSSWIDYAMLALFVIFTVEIGCKIIVSGFLFNAEEYSTIDREKGLKAAIVSKYRNIFGPQRQASVRHPEANDHDAFAASFARSLTALHQKNPAQYTTAEDKKRQQLARRAFLRHSLNRIDFVAVVSFWINFVLAIIVITPATTTNPAKSIEATYHMYVFRMLSCLRIIRLLYLTNGTKIILTSLKKAAPLLVNVSFLIGFFWLLFAIVGVQAFKSSFRRQCVWSGTVDGSFQTYTNNFTLCGGYLDNVTGAVMPYIKPDGTNGTSAKGYLCPKGSVCLEQTSLYNGTVSFDNIANSLELVFVTMSANTFTDLMYYTTNSDYLPAALFFVAGIVIMLLWLTNLLIAVITSSFQVIREESKASAFTGDAQQPEPKAFVIEPRRRTPTLRQWYERSEPIWLVVIFYGLLCQATRSASMGQGRADFIKYSEIIVSSLLVIEILFRVIADWRTFHRRKRNVFDALLAIITTVMLLPPIMNSGQAYAWLTVFQIIRIYRVVWGIPITRTLIAKVVGNATGIGNLVLFVFLITYLVAILAAQLFRGDIPQADVNGVTIRVTFFTMWNSFLGMYQILSSENWTTIMYNVTSYNNYLDTGWIAAMFFIAWFILSYFILINMFIAVIQENFDVSEDEKRLQQVRAFLQRKELGSTGTSGTLALSNIFRFGKARKVKDPLDFGQAAMEMLLKDAVVRDFLDEEVDLIPPILEADTPPLNHTATDGPPRRGLHALWRKFLTRVWHREPNPFYTSMQFSRGNETFDPRAMAREAVSASTQKKKAQRDFLNRHPMYNTSLFLFKPDNSIRRLCQKVVAPGRGSERFEGVEPNRIIWSTFSVFIYLAVMAMVVLACVTTPLFQKEYFVAQGGISVQNWFVYSDLAFAIIFSVEAIIKVIADGAFWTPNAYFRSLWGFIDGLVLLTLWIDVVASLNSDGPVSRAVGAFKALRALRLLNVSDSARETFTSVILVGGWRVISAAFVSLALLIPFAIYGVNLFNGQLVSCNDGNTSGDLSQCWGEFNSTPYSNSWNVTAPRVASNPYYDFDNFGGALFILYQIVSQEGWIDVMWSAQSITGRGQQPANFASQGNAVFFVVFNLMATVFVLTLFISVFMRAYTEQTGVAYLTAEQRSWMEMRKLFRQVAPSKRSSHKNSAKWKVWCYKKAVQKHGRWHQFVTGILVCHLVLLMLEYYPEPTWWTRVRDFTFMVFTIFYVANTIIRIVGLTWPRFRKSSWDMYALVAVTGTFITTILFFSPLRDIYPQTMDRLHKLFLVTITLLLVPRNNALDQLLKTAAASLTSIGNLLATWFVLFLVWAIALTQLFGLTRFGSQGTNNLNLRSVPKALIVLFRMSCGEGWNQIMEDYAQIQPPFCTESESFFDSDCGSPVAARVLFISWNILSMYIFISLFVSLIYESFSYVYQRSSGLQIVTREETRRFKEAWAIFDPDGTGWISKADFGKLLGELSGVFAMRIHDPEDSVHRILEDVRVATPAPRGNSIASVSQATGIDLQKLNERLARIDIKKVRAQRRRYNIFYEEVMVSADPDRGISFTAVLMVLAHYNVINDNKSLKLDEFLRRRARLQRVEDEVSRRTVMGFFDTLHLNRRFRRHLDRHNSARITDFHPPTFDVPEIVVNDDERADTDGSEAGKESPMFSATHMPDRRSAFREAWGLDGHGAERWMFPPLSPSHSNQSHPAQQYTGSDGGTSSPARSPRLSPLRASQAGPSRERGLSHSHSAFSFDASDGGGGGSGSGSPRRGHSRQGSAVSGVSAEGVLEVFGQSAWGESLRRSFTLRRSREMGE